MFQMCLVAGRVNDWPHLGMLLLTAEWKQQLVHSLFGSSHCTVHCAQFKGRGGHWESPGSPTSSQKPQPLSYQGRARGGIQPWAPTLPRRAGNQCVPATCSSQHTWSLASRMGKERSGEPPRNEEVSEHQYHLGIGLKWRFMGRLGWLHWLSIGLNI